MIISSDEIYSQVSLALQEDLGTKNVACSAQKDVSSALLNEKLSIQAAIISREAMVLCGQAWVEAAFKLIDAEIQITWAFAEGTYIADPETLCSISGLVQPILTAERTALNFLQTLSATATQTYRYVQALKETGTGTQLLDTRKTLPGLRKAQKYAVRCGGGINHRLGLYDAFLIKENHIRACGSITKAIAKARKINPQLFLEIEVENLEELAEALRAKPDRILLDNFDLAALKKAVKMNQDYAISLEASGGINLQNIKEVAQTGINFISVGAITKSIQAIDLSLLINEVVRI